MKLRRQLILIACVMLLLPWAVIQFAKQIEQSLRESQQQNHIQLAGFIASLLRPEWPTPASIGGRILNVRQYDTPIYLDGYQDDWAEIPALSDPKPDSIRAVKAATDGQDLYLLVAANDASIQYRQPSARSQPADHFELITGYLAGGKAVTMLETEGPGQIKARLAGSWSSVHGMWQEDGPGFILELRIPLASLQDGFSLRWIDIDKSAAWVFNRNTLDVLGSDAEPMLLNFAPPGLIHKAQELTPEYTRLRLTDAQGATLLEYDNDLMRYIGMQDDVWRMAMRRLLRWAVDGVSQASESQPLAADAPRSTWDASATSELANLITRYPVKSETGKLLGWVQLEQRTPQIAAVANDALFAAVGGSVALLIVIMLILFGYASWLSWRITHLSKGIVSALDTETKFSGRFQASRLPDELGDLSRSFSEMLTQLRSYSEYMESFASKLTHECRTPLAIVSSSLQLLESADNEQEKQEYLGRARAGAERISALLTAMRQASRLEATIQSQSLETFDLSELISELQQSYRPLVEPRRLELELPEAPIVADISAELIAQAVDKLLENARDFTAPDGAIYIGVEEAKQERWIYVENEGDPIPEYIKEKLFTPFMSVRQDGGQELHLGLGLVIVKLIADFHQARIKVENTARGVRFAIGLPRS
ncbi:proteobacterial dedicated sortase system histidine kinase [Hahella sp. HN01]|uniref:proteobacterial dedicated sortase system histidine kinase n=1 Tax=Hahella sp. HN01 TaxID=2847262 RepID=UPI001C1F078F|nr:proteobacterial dedicated sortase system histidine kinase [Hahella sp. HN01]MBU6955003.1 proteobacterial dedicated sortase system histidine kinase [Hahella sp. HN01]